jgi:hypothetical protein
LHGSCEPIIAHGYEFSGGPSPASFTTAMESEHV